MPRRRISGCRDRDRSLRAIAGAAARRYAGLPAADIATAKAYTALSFRRNISELAKMVRDGQMDASLARMPHIAMLAGALAGLDAIRDKLNF